MSRSTEPRRLRPPRPDPITWLVLARDVPPTIRVQGTDQLSAAMILDVDTGLVRGVAIETTVAGALRRAVRTALSQPASGQPAGAPSTVLCAEGLVDPVRTALPDTAAPIIEVQPGPEAEDIFDSFLGHLAGRAQPDEFPTPADWRLLIDTAAEFRGGEPWSRWSDEHDLLLDVDVSSAANQQYVAVVLGQAGVQRGLVLYPGDTLPGGLRDAALPCVDDRQRDPQAPPPGSLLFTLDPREELPVDLAGKAIRYGWAVGDALLPVFIAFTESGAAEIGQSDAQQLTVGIAAVTALDRRGPVLADAKPVTGRLTLGDGRSVTYQIRHRRTREEPEQPQLRLHLAGHDLLPPGTPVTLGHLTWDALAVLRADAHVHRPAP